MLSCGTVSLLALAGNAAMMPATTQNILKSNLFITVCAIVVESKQQVDAIVKAC